MREGSWARVTRKEAKSISFFQGISGKSIHRGPIENYHETVFLCEVISSKSR